MSAVRLRIRLRGVPPKVIVVTAVSAATAAAVTVGWLGWRLTRQDEALAVQRAQEGLEAAADLAVAALSRTLLGVDADLGSWLAEGSESGEASPLVSDVEADDRAVLVRAAGGTVTGVPRGRLLYDPVVPADGPLVDLLDRHAALFDRGDRLEFVDRDYAAALRVFAGLARSADPAMRAAALVRRARAARKAGNADEALAAYAELEQLADVLVEGRPVPLLGAHASCTVLEHEGRREELAAHAARFREALYSGRWLVPRALFDVYAADAERWAAGSRDASGGAIAVDRRRRLTDAVAWLLTEHVAGQDPSSSGRLAFGNSTDAVLLVWRQTAGTVAALAALPDWLAERSQDLAPALARPRARLVLSDQAGGTILGDPLAPDMPVAIRDAAQTDLPWTVRVVPLERPGTGSNARLRRLVAAGGIGLFGLILVGGSYLAARAVVREMEAVRMQSEFVSAVSHEFRTPLSSIRHVSDLLSEGRVRDEGARQRYYGALQSESERLQRLVETLLDFRRMEDGAQAYRLERLRVSEVVRDVATRFTEEASRRGYTLETNIPENLPDVMADASALALAIWNLLDNAVKYSPSNKTVTLTVRAEMSGVAIAVSDRGLGIAPDEQQRVFARFARGRSAQVSGAGGTGLGLAIVRHIVDAHRGEIGLQSEPGFGSTFTIRLPALREEAAS